MAEMAMTMTTRDMVTISMGTISTGMAGMMKGMDMTVMGMMESAGTVGTASMAGMAIDCPRILKEQTNMKNDLRGAWHGALMALLLTGVVASASAAVTLPLGSSSQVPAAAGQVRLKHTKNGNVEIKLNVKHLAPAGRITPGANVFVVWARGLEPGAEAQNLGALKTDKNLNGKLTAGTAMSSFDLFITCEQAQTATFPATPELLPLHYVNK